MSQVLQRFLERARQKKVSVHCVGDAMIDEYYEVEVTRISPEHPIPVMKCKNYWTKKPGGAANVAYQFRHLNADVSLLCLPDQIALQNFKKNQIKCIFEDFYDNFYLPIKRRYLDNGVQVAPRHDFEKDICSESIKNYLNKLSIKIENIPKPDVAIFSDYDKGFFYFNDINFINLYKNSIKIVDPKRGPLDKWIGCDIFKPNFKEAKELSGYDNWREQARYLQEKIRCDAVVITMGGEKVVGRWKSEEFCFVPDKKVNAKSVIGAGDCFAAFFAMSIAHGFNPIEAAEVAWNAGALYVQEKMNRPIVAAELSLDKIVNPKDLISRDFKLVFTNGCFDILHKGHLETLKFAKSQGDRLVVALNSDQSIKRIKDSSRPILPLEHRMAVLASMKDVDFVTYFEEDNPLKIIEQIVPDVLVKGDGYLANDVIGSNIAKKTVIAPSVPESSTTKFAEEWLERKINDSCET